MKQKTPPFILSRLAQGLALDSEGTGLGLEAGMEVRPKEDSLDLGL